MTFPTDLDIARQATLRPLTDIAVGGRDPARPARALRHRCGEDRPGGDRRDGRPAAGQVRRGLGDHADSARRGQDHRRGRAEPGVLAHRQAGDAGDPPAVDGADVRHQGWRRRRRLQPGRADGAAQPAPHRRRPRRHRRHQHVRRRRRRARVPRQPVRARPAPDHLAAFDRRQRPVAAQHRDRPRVAARRHATRDRLRHHRRVGGHGDAGAVRPTCRISAAGSAGSSSATRSRAIRSPPRTSRSPARWR